MQKINKTNIKKMLKNCYDAMYTHIWKDDEAEYFICTYIDRLGVAYVLNINVDMRYATRQMLSENIILERHDNSDFVFGYFDRY